MRTTVLIVVLLLLITGCSAQSGGQAEALKTLDTYLHAFVDKDEARMSALVCSKWSTDALLEYDAFQNVKTKLDGLSCKVSGTENNAFLLNCQGKILATYTNEAQAFDLGQRVYRLEKSGADWLVCGYTGQ